MNTEILKPWNVVETGDDEGEITLYGDVADSTPWYADDDEQFITPAGFAEDLQKIAGKSKVTVRLNSCGGSLYTGLAIHNAIKSLKAKTTVIVDGIAASAASVIMCAGDEVLVYPGSIVMIHEPKVGVCDYFGIDDLREIIKMLKAGNDAATNVYAAKTGMPEDEIKRLLHNETWLVGSEAVEKGFADRVIDGAAVSAQLVGKDVLMVAGVKHDVRALKVPDTIQQVETAPNCEAADGTDDMPGETAGVHEKGEQNAMTKENTASATETNVDANVATEPNAQATEPTATATAQVDAVAEAVAAERKRLQDIDAIASQIGDTALVDAAKYGSEPMTAEALAFAALKKQQEQGKAAMKAIAEDAKQANSVEAAAVEDPIDTATGESTPDDEAKAGAEAAQKYLGKE